MRNSTDAALAKYALIALVLVFFVGLAVGPTDAQAGTPETISLAPDPLELEAGSSGEMSIVVSPAAPAGGWAFEILPTGDITTPSSGALPEGATTATFTVTAGASSGSATVAAFIGSISDSATVEIAPPPVVDERYTGCLTRNGSIVRVAIGDEPARACSDSHTQISWNIDGPEGAPGPPGPGGPEGTQGQQGEPALTPIPVTGLASAISGAEELNVPEGVALTSVNLTARGPDDECWGAVDFGGTPLVIVDNVETLDALNVLLEFDSVGLLSDGSLNLLVESGGPTACTIWYVGYELR